MTTGYAPDEIRALLAKPVRRHDGFLPPPVEFLPPPVENTAGTDGQRHDTLAGEVLKYPRPGPELAAFLARVRAAAENARVSEPELVELLYSAENPLLDPTRLHGRGAVMRETFADPTYHVMLDLLDRKRMQQRKLHPKRTGDRYTMSVGEAAAELDVSRTAVQKAIGVGQLDAVRRGHAYLIDPGSVATYRERVVRRGPRAGTD